MQTEKPNQHRRSIERYVWIPRRTRVVAAIICLLMAFLLWLWAVAVQSGAEGAEDAGTRGDTVLEICDEAVVFCVDGAENGSDRYGA